MAAFGFDGKLTRAEMKEARLVLGPRLYSMFVAMPGPYRKHGYAVYKKVEAAGSAGTALLQAALLHDCGKFEPESGRYVTLPHRVAVVLLEAAPWSKALLARLSGGHRRRGLLGRVLYPFYLSAHHPSLGARLAAESGANGEVVRLIREHQRHGIERDEALRRLQAADDLS